MRGKVLTWLLISDLDKTSCKQDKTFSQSISPIVESNCHITKQGLTKLKSRLVFYFSQICWVVVSFLAIGLAIGANQLTLMTLSISMMGFILHTIMFLFLFKFFLFQLHDVNKSRKNLTEAVEDMKHIDDEEKRLLLRDINNLEPVSAFGLFDIDRSTLTSMISISFTYIIILIQFKQNDI